MARNAERDEREMEKRKNNMLAAGLRLFSTYGIEAVSLQRIADEAQVGIATLYNYYTNKVNLCVAISSWMWKNVWLDSLKIAGQEELKAMTAYGIIEFYIDDIIRIYQNKPEILRFSSEYKTFVCRESKNPADVQEHMDALSPVNEMFKLAFAKGKVDKTIRTDIAPEKFFTTVALTMLGMAERYAQGLVWGMSEDKDYTNELIHLKEMLLSWAKGE